jgi:hypothetical protein
MTKFRSSYVSYEYGCSNKSMRTIRFLRLRHSTSLRVHTDGIQFLATYLGRPPHTSYRYCIRQPSHELSDDEVCSEGVELALALSRLEHGNQISKRPYRTSWRRAWSQHVFIRELILEVAIGPGTDDIDVRVWYASILILHVTCCAVTSQ